jgi:hypothetical protein
LPAGKPDGAVLIRYGFIISRRPDSRRRILLSRSSAKSRLRPASTFMSRSGSQNDKAFF